ncbi:hypothetical protein [Nodosilinea sp. E11]|uniref:hypothetical protein n=1 Tax=Nodosilinea sp. E11 TaxID=3037479 RepID=UPI002934804F|nr:hypothetical protein [Nodosilinea sp. E11]WOD37383.1 hypothetical protein RRF56_02575 [Nodosilinea sp. E11]WOD37945.1 hypothetical protein RRF56_17165 [Nodosilinea sp. E11]
MASPSQQKILKQIETKGHYSTTSERSAKAAKALPDVQHVYSCEIPTNPGKTTHRFIKRQSCLPQ